MALCTIPTSLSLIENASENYLQWLKCPNESFDNLDNFTITKVSGNETAVTSGNILALDLPDTNGAVTLLYNICQQSGDFNIELDIDDYQYDQALDGPYFVFRIRDASIGDAFGIQLWYENRYVLKSTRYKAGVGSSGAEYYPAGRPTKIKLIRNGTTMLAYYYYDSAWVKIDENAYADWAGMDNIEMYFIDKSDHGGSIQVSDMKANIDTYNIYWSLTSPVTKVTGTKISGITKMNYRHVVTPNIEYFYVITGQNENGESDISDEVSGTAKDMCDLYYDTNNINAYDTIDIGNLYSVSAMQE